MGAAAMPPLNSKGQNMRLISSGMRNPFGGRRQGLLDDMSQDAMRKNRRATRLRVTRYRRAARLSRRRSTP